MLYVVMTILLFLLRYALANQGGARNQIYVFVISGLFLFSAFRYMVGCDWNGYYVQFIRAGNLDWSTLTKIREPIWWASLSWISIQGWPYPIVNVLSSLVFFVGVHILARRQPDPLGFLVLLFPILIVNMTMSGIRQGAAIGLLCIALTSFIDRRPLRYASWVLLAGGFHASVLIFMLLLPVASGRYTRSRLAVAALLAIPGAYFLASSDAAELATARYVGSGNDAAGSAFRVGILGLTALYFFLFARDKWLSTWPRDFGLASAGAMGMALAFLIVPISSVIGDRIGYYFIPIQAMIFARLPFLSFRQSAAWHSAAPYLGLLLVFTVWSQLSWHFQECYVPYQTWIFGFPGGNPVGF